jgi:hypothetical protein
MNVKILINVVATGHNRTETRKFLLASLSQTVVREINIGGMQIRNTHPMLENIWQTEITVIPVEKSGTKKK